MTVYDDYLAWHHLQVDTDDIDPVYPVLQRWATDQHMDAHQRAWIVMLHVCYYHLGSTLTAHKLIPDPQAIPSGLPAMEDLGLLNLPTGTERRAHRSKRQLANHLTALRRTFAGRDVYDTIGNSGWGWQPLNEWLAAIGGNGRWAAYKGAEMLQKVALAPTEATDAGHAHSSGPRHGLGLLYSDLPDGNTGRDVAILDAVTAELARTLGEGDIAQVETSLCDFHSLWKGGYYLGHDIDQMLAQLREPRCSVPESIWPIRADVFAPDLLGEFRGWSKPRRELKRLYADHRVLDWRAA